MTDLDLTLCSALNTYCFQNIWNEPVSEYRAMLSEYVGTLGLRPGVSTVWIIWSIYQTQKRPFYIYAVAPGSVGQG